MPYKPSSPILIITLGSFNKRSGGDSAYKSEEALHSRLPKSYGELLLQTRHKAYKWLTGEQHAEWNGIPLAQLEWNQGLIDGPDLGASNKSAQYLPAISRFEGRFFQTVGTDRRKRLSESPHHVLFLCGLYGLISPLEPIQMYSCPVDHGWRVFDIWDEHLTNILLAYIHEHNISRVFDLTAMSARRKLIGWGAVRQALPGNVLHASGSMSAGDDLLVPFGALMRDRFLPGSVDKLLSIGYESSLESVGQSIWFRDKPSPRANEPRETMASITLADELDRKRRGVAQLLNRLGAHGRPHHELYGECIWRLRRAGIITLETADDMRTIGDLRNQVQYTSQRDPTEDELRQVRDAWRRIRLAFPKEILGIPEFQA